MALGFGASILNGTYTKICTITCDNADAAADYAMVFTDHAMSALPVAPVDVTIVRTVATDPGTSAFAITAVATTGFTLRKLTAGAGGAITLQVCARAVHAIDR